MHEELIAMLTELFDGNEAELSKFAESPADYLEANGFTAADVDAAQVLSEALAGSQLDADAQAQVMEAYQAAAAPYDVPAEAQYEPHQMADVFAQSLNATLEEGDKIDIDNSLYAEAGGADPYGEPKPHYGDDGGEIKGGIDQYNTTEVTKADDGSVVADYATDSNFQTGSDNLQADGVWADNITTGDGNVVASGASTIGDGNVDAHTIKDSEFGYGDQDRSVDVDVDIKDSGNVDEYVNKEYSDDDVHETDIDVSLKDGGYEPVHQVDDYDAGAAALENIADDLLDG
ncbi:MAG: hypothetical protein AAF962_20800 [Actinomycetota bacterium]